MLHVSHTLYWHTRSNSIKSPASGAGNTCEPRLMSQAGKVREVVRVDQCDVAVRAVEVPVFVSLRTSRSLLTEVESP